MLDLQNLTNDEEMFIYALLYCNGNQDEAEQLRKYYDTTIPTHESSDAVLAFATLRNEGVYVDSQELFSAHVDWMFIYEGLKLDNIVQKYRNNDTWKETREQFYKYEYKE